jgi:hypothetical protein
MSYRVFCDFILIIGKSQDEYENQWIESGRFSYHQGIRDASDDNPQSCVTVECEKRSNELLSIHQKPKISSSKTVCQDPYVFDQAHVKINSGKFFHILFCLMKYMYPTSRRCYTSTVYGSSKEQHKIKLISRFI